MEQRVPLLELNQYITAVIDTVASALVLASEGPAAEALFAYDECLTAQLRASGVAGGASWSCRTAGGIVNGSRRLQ